ncbi:MAG: DUF4131 domain-containing protein, partial [Candidatus Omnitrophota bacterium]
MKRLPVVLASVFCLGVLVAGIIKLNFLLICFLIIVSLVFCCIFFRNRASVIFILFLVFSLGFLHFINAKIPSRTHISRIGFYNKADPYIVRGFICNEPAIKYGKTIFLFRTKEIEFNRFKQNCCGDILVHARNAPPVLYYGENLVLSGSLARPYFKNRNAHIIMRVKTAQDLIRLNKNSGFIIKRFSLWLKSKIE